MTAALLAAASVCLWGYAHRPPPHRRGTGGGRRRPSAPAPASDEWAHWLDTVASCVRGGDSLRAAVQRVDGHHAPVGEVVRPGATLDCVIGARPASADEAVVVQVLTIAAALGGSTAATLQAGAALLHERAAVRAEAHAHAAQARLSVRVLTAVPIGFALWSAAANATFRHALVTPVGVAAALSGGALSASGWWWMGRIVRRATP